MPRTYLVGSRSLPPGVTELPAHHNGVDIAVVAEAGHLMYLDNPEGFAHAIADAFGAS